MSQRIAPFALALSLLVLTACAEQNQNTRGGMIDSGTMQGHGGGFGTIDRPLTPAQATAVSNWMHAQTDCSHFSMDIPDDPVVQLALQDTDGEHWRIDVYQRNNGTITAYVYRGQRVAPMRCGLTAEQLATLKTALGPS